MPRHAKGVDPSLVGVKAFRHPAVKSWWAWIMEDYTPSSSIGLITPCSNVKPYIQSPVSRKIRAVLRRLGLWSMEEDKPKGIVWLYLSDLLVFVPYERAEEYPPCCYEVPPDIVLSNEELRRTVTGLLAEATARLSARGLRKVIVFLPRKHLQLWSQARQLASSKPVEVRASYHILRVRERLEPVLEREVKGE